MPIDRHDDWCKTLPTRSDVDIRTLWDMLKAIACARTPSQASGVDAWWRWIDEDKEAGDG